MTLLFGCALGLAAFAATLVIVILTDG